MTAVDWTLGYNGNGARAGDGEAQGALRIQPLLLGELADPTLQLRSSDRQGQEQWRLLRDVHKEDKSNVFGPATRLRYSLIP